MPRPEVHSLTCLTTSGLSEGRPARRLGPCPVLGCALDRRKTHLLQFSRSCPCSLQPWPRVTPGHPSFYLLRLQETRCLPARQSNPHPSFPDPLKKCHCGWENAGKKTYKKHIGLT